MRIPTDDAKAALRRAREKSEPAEKPYDEQRTQERFICTRAEPWTPEKSRRAAHPGAQEVGEQESGWPGGDVVTYECPFCKHRWQKELPQ